MSDTSTPSGGRIMLVGLGPGSHAHLTARARAAIAEADTVIGYVTYIRLVADLLDGKEVIRKSMTEELDRAIEAFERARAGKKVALISSGDAGVYGMAGPTFEVLFQAGWTPDSGIDVEIIPGASALNTCAALVGAPLTHDFCAISLSDLLTPWPTIARRLDAVLGTAFEALLFGSIPDAVAVPSVDDIEAVKREQERLRAELAQLKLAFGLLSDPRRGGPVRRGVPPLVTTP